MSENDSALNPPSEAGPADASITPPSPELQRSAPPADPGPAPPGWQPELGLPERSIAQKPSWPHPNFGWSLLWCLLFLCVTQVPGAFIAVLVIAGLAILAPGMLPTEKLSDQAALMKSEAVNVALGAAFFVTEMLVVGFSWLVIRLVVGRDWMRQLGVRRPGLAHTLLALAIFPAFALLGNVAYGLLRASHRVPSISDPNPLNLFFFWAAVFLVLGIAVLAAWKLAGSGWTRRLAARPARPADFLITAAVLPLLSLCVLLLYEGLRRVVPVTGLETIKLGGMEEMGDIFGKWPWGFAVLVVGLGPGIGEELWCRGFLGRGLVGSHGVVLGVLASSFCFGLIHVDPCQGLMAMVMGLWLHFIYLTTRSLLLPMLLHFLNNSAAVLEPHVPHLSLLDAKPGDIPWTVYVSAAFLLVAGVYALYQSRPRLVPRYPDLPHLWRPSFEGVEYPPADSGMVVEHRLPSPAATALASGAFALFMLACVQWVMGG